MKKVFSLLLVIAVLLMAFPIMSYQTNAASLPSPDILNGYENICLTYHFRPESGNSVSQTAADLLPYVAYLDTNGNAQDFFFDSYLFLPWNANAPSGATMHGGTNNPTIASDWTAYVDDVFLSNRNVNALDTAMGQAKSALNDNTKKAGVFFTILYPAYNCTNFGSLGGKSLDLSKQSDREYAIKWIIDEQIKRFTEGGYQNLDLLGFYWLEEEIYSTYDQSMMQYASEYLHSLGLKFIWIPWYQAPGYKNWETYGFDLACLQPNEIWQSTAMPNRVSDCAELCNTYGMSMQIETRDECAQQEYFDRYAKYLYGGLKSGAMDAVKFYYQGGKTGVYYSACYSKETLFRLVYDLTYQYAKGTLTGEDLGLEETPPFEVPTDVEWYSYGKTYTGCESFVDGNGMPYQDVSGTELTDGVLGNSTNGTEWHAYHKSILDEDGRMSTTLDLGEVYTDITHVMAQFNDYQPFNIGAPSDLKIYVSEDGTNFELLASPKIKHNDDDYYFKYVSETPISARYVKMSFTNSTGYNFVFCSEFLVGKQMEGQIPDDSSVDDSSADDSSSDDSSVAEPYPFDLPADVDWVSYGKTYTGCESYTDGNGMPYQNVSGKELTDGVLGGSTKGTQSHAYHVSVIDNDSRMSTTLDLGEAYTGLTHIIAQFNDYEPFNIGAPTDLKIYISDDGESFELLATPEILQGENYFYFEYIPETSFDARYVKMSFINDGNLKFVFCSEFLVGKQIDEPIPDDSSDDSSVDSSSDDYSDDSSVDSSDDSSTEYSQGDFNKNDRIDTMDYILLKRYYFGNYYADEQQDDIADVNNSGGIDTMDYIITKRIYFGTWII